MSRLRKIQQALLEKRLSGRKVRYFFSTPDETSEQCLERNGVDEDSPDINVVIVRWASDDEPETPE
jgi:hypothetical protein